MTGITWDHPELELFSDCYKDVNGFRPRGSHTPEQALEWMRWFRNPEVQEELVAQWRREEEEWDAYMAEQAKQDAEDDRWYDFQHNADDPDWFEKKYGIAD